MAAFFVLTLNLWISMDTLPVAAYHGWRGFAIRACNI